MEIKIKYLSSGSRLIESRMPGCPGRAEPSEAEHVLSPLSALQIDFQHFHGKNMTHTLEKCWFNDCTQKCIDCIVIILL